METNKLNLFVEINHTNYVFVVGKYDDNQNLDIHDKIVIPNTGIKNFKFVNIIDAKNEIKKTIQALENKLNYVFKDATVILDNFNHICLNVSGYKKLSGSQVLKENISYILNSLKSTVNETENGETILHIFNSKSILDNVYVENLPIGLFGDFYSHELTFFLINNNDLKNIKLIFNENNLKINKLIIKNYIEGIQLIDNKKIESFFKIKINKNNSNLSFFENSSFRYTENFPFGTNIILQDICKVCSIKNDMLEKILLDDIFKTDSTDNDKEYLDEKYFSEGKFRKIRKKLLIDIAKARIEEIAKIILYKNINTVTFRKKNVSTYLIIEDKKISNNFKNDFKNFFSNIRNIETNMLDSFEPESSILRAAHLTLYGWKKEAIPVAITKNSLITRIFKSLFE